MADEENNRQAAIGRVKAKWDFRSHAVVYPVINAALVGIWAASGVGYFWPIWSIGFWGMGLIFNWWGAYHEGRPITEDDIARDGQGRAVCPIPRLQHGSRV